MGGIFANCARKNTSGKVLLAARFLNEDVINFDPIAFTCITVWICIA
jgi:hypothetical protein